MKGTEQMHGAEEREEPAQSFTVHLRGKAVPMIRGKNRLMKTKSRTRTDNIAPFPRRKQGSFGMFKLVIVAGLLLLGLFFMLIGVQIYQYNRLYNQLAAAELQMQERELRNEAMAEEIEKLNDPGYIGMLARKLLGLVRPGEIVFQLED